MHFSSAKIAFFKVVLMMRSGFAVSLFLAIALISQASPQPQEMNQDLVQYVRDARKAGLKDAQIQVNALKAGWPESAVKEAVAYVRKAPNADAAAPATKLVEPVASKAAPPAPPVTTPSAAATTTTPGATGLPAPDTGTVPPKVVSRGAPEDYQIGEGDVLQITVWGEKEASVPSVVVRPDGKISMPLIKEIVVAGMTPTQVERAVTDQLSKVIKGADITVVVVEINSKKVYIIGAVKKEGPLPYTYRMTIMQALTEAGGLTDYAKRKKIYVIRNENGRQFKLLFNYDAILRGEHMEQNIQLIAGDQIVVPH
jgi:polysaccharide export outer membrane protein